MLIHKEKPVAVATVAGSWSANTANINGLLKQVIVTPTTDTTVYDFSLTDSKDDVILNRTDETGTLNEEVELGMNGVYTMAITSATRNESFDVVLYIRER